MLVRGAIGYLLDGEQGCFERSLDREWGGSNVKSIGDNDPCIN